MKRCRAPWSGITRHGTAPAQPPHTQEGPGGVTPTHPPSPRARHSVCQPVHCAVAFGGFAAFGAHNGVWPCLLVLRCAAA